MDSYRHHVATRPVVVFVPVPCGGSPEPLRRKPPPAYKRNQWSPWRPQRSIPTNRKAAARRMIELLRELDRRAEDARQMLRPNAALLKQWLCRAA
jgi:hypothetical protein